MALEVLIGEGGLGSGSRNGEREEQEISTINIGEGGKILYADELTEQLLLLRRILRIVTRYDHIYKNQWFSQIPTITS